MAKAAQAKSPLLPSRFSDARALSSKAHVFVAHDSVSGKDVIVKTGAVDDTRLQREHWLLQRLQGEKVPALFDFIVEKGWCFMVLEYIPWPPLSTFLRRKLSARNVGAMCVELAKPIHALNSLGYLYRDFADFHVLCDTPTNLRWIDFGNCIGPLSRTGTVANPDTAGYWRTMAPEEFVVDRPLGVVANVYSLGAIYCFIATGKFPLDHIATDPSGVAAYHKSGRSAEGIGVSLKKVRSLDFRRVLARATDADPSARFANVADLVAAVERNM